MALDLSEADVEEIYGVPEFEAAMRAKGDDLWETWSLTYVEKKARRSIHQKILGNADKYWQELHNIALSTEEKAETRVRILLSFLESTKQLGGESEVGERITLSPATIKLINHGDDVYERHRKLKPPVESDVPDHES